jgi:antitoxin component YwqK of YwqJK toxin-antitoxin module
MRILLIILLGISFNSFAQCKSYIIGVHGDTLNCVDMNGKKQGRWAIHVDELRGEPGFEEEGVYLDDKKDGLWRRYSLVGDKVSEENYRWGNKDGICRYYSRLGGLLREESWRAVNPADPYDTVNVYDVVDPTKVVDRKVIKLEGTTYKNGEFRYYDPEQGVVVKTEVYRLDKLVTNNNTDDELKPLDITDNSKSKTDSLGKKTVTKPQAVLDYEKKNSGKKKVKVRDGSTGY